MDFLIKQTHKELNDINLDDLNIINVDEQIENKKECQKEIFDFFVEYQYENTDDIEEELKEIEEKLKVKNINDN